MFNGMAALRTALRWWPSSTTGRTQSANPALKTELRHLSGKRTSLHLNKEEKVAGDGTGRKIQTLTEKKHVGGYLHDHLKRMCPPLEKEAPPLDLLAKAAKLTSFNPQEPWRPSSANPDRVERIRLPSPRDANPRGAERRRGSTIVNGVVQGGIMDGLPLPSPNPELRNRLRKGRNALRGLQIHKRKHNEDERRRKHQEERQREAEEEIRLLQASLDRLSERLDSLQIDFESMTGFGRSSSEEGYLIDIRSTNSRVSHTRVHWATVTNRDPQLEWDMESSLNRIFKRGGMVINVQCPHTQPVDRDIVLKLFHEAANDLGRVRKDEGRATMEQVARLLRVCIKHISELIRIEIPNRKGAKEEAFRLVTHMGAVLDVLEGGGVVGRTLDFFFREMFREMNTVASKTSDLKVRHTVVLMKTAVEDMKEQVANVQ